MLINVRMVHKFVEIESLTTACLNKKNYLFGFKRIFPKKKVIFCILEQQILNCGMKKTMFFRYVMLVLCFKVGSLFI